MNALRVGLVMVIVSAALTGCWDRKAEPIAPTAQSCSPEFYKALPAGKQRDNLVETCMTQGQYHAAAPQTF